MPFITEELWQQLPYRKEAESLCVRKYPGARDGIEDKAAEDKMQVIMDAVSGIRSIRGELNISPSHELKAYIKALDNTGDILTENITYVEKLARAKDIEIGTEIQAPKNAATAIRHAMEIFIPLKGLIDVGAEMGRLKKEITKLEEELRALRKKLGNENFIKKAPEAVVEANRAKYTELYDKIESLQQTIEKLKNIET
jgi:valyl-tRNA synthetase